MAVSIKQVGPDDLTRYGEAPDNSFMVKRALNVQLVADGLGGMVLREEEVAHPYRKGDDASVEESLAAWAREHDISKWGIFVAVDGDSVVGRAAVAFDTPAMNSLERRRDLAVLMDIRVLPAYRQQGIGSRLFKHAADWARQKGCKQLKIETENVNVPACKFYRRQGCTLRAIDRYAYAACPEARRQPEIATEAMLIWQLDL